MLKVLEFFGEPFIYGGQEAFILNMYNNFENKEIHYTFFTPYSLSNEKIIEMASKRGDLVVSYNYKFVTKLRKHNLKKAAKQILKTDNYDVIHIHSGSLYTLLEVAKLAKKYGVKKVIVHSHCTGTNNFKYRLIKFYSDLFINKYVDVYLACSDDAAKWKFPKNIIQNKEYKVIKNGIDTNKFLFDDDKRNQYRDKFGLKDEIVLCNVGRYDVQKNQQYIVELAKLLNDANCNFKVLIVGDGPKKQSVVELIQKYNLDNKFILLEKRSDISELLMASDVFVFPSIFEGLGIVAIEAQATGLLTLCSQYIPKDACLTDLVNYIELENINEWVKKIQMSRQGNIDRKKYYKQIELSGFNAKESAFELEKIYLKDMGDKIMKYVLCEGKEKDYNASSKARIDVEDILQNVGYKKLYLNSISGKGMSKLKKFFTYFSNYFKVKKSLKILEKDDIVMFQHPMVNTCLFINKLIKKLNKKHVNTIVLIHDLDSLRASKKNVGLISYIRLVDRDKKILDSYNHIICHNNKMKQELLSYGIKESKIVTLEIFDYLNPNHKPIKHTYEKSVIIAGNLSKTKCAYLYELNKVDGINFNLYGKGFEDYGANNIVYKGAFLPEELIEKLEGSFGLVWDGPTIETCAGDYGNYLRFNNPHKTSLYLTAGLPVIVWKQSAMAEFVEIQNVGISVNSLLELNYVLEKMTKSEYDIIAENARNLSQKLTNGYFLKNAIEKSEK